MFSKKATKFNKIFTVDLTVCSKKCQMDGEDFVNFCGLLGKYELYNKSLRELSTVLPYSIISTYQYLFPLFYKLT